MDSRTLYSAILALTQLRDKWSFYAVDIADDALPAHSALQESLSYAIQLWLLDVYYTAHDILLRNHIAARLTRKKFPEGLNKQEIENSVLKRLRVICAYLSGSSGFLHIARSDVIESECLAQLYFKDPAGCFKNLSPEEGQVLLARLSSLIIEEDLF